MTINSEFINRKDELSYLQKEYEPASFRFISLIGRRRVGKTRLIEEFIKDKKNSIYFLVQEMDDKEIRLSLAKRLHDNLEMTFLGTPSWEEILEQVFRQSHDRQIILIFDEFQRFSGINKSVPSILQGLIDKHAKNSRLFLIVMGSSIGMMHHLFDHTSALYGRRTGQMYIQPLKPFTLKEWFKGIQPEKLIELYSVFGGTPKYLETIDATQSIAWNIKNNIISKNSTLYTEPEIMIKTELPDSSTYFNILKLISEGKTKPNEIANSLTIKPTSLSYFLTVLEKDMELIKREQPVTEKKPEQSKKAIYLVNDNFFRFWFRYIYPNKSDIEIGNTEPIIENIETDLNSFIAHSYEGICKSLLLKMNRTPALPFPFTKIGAWWGHYRENNTRKEQEIDIVAFNETTKDILFCECKWKNNVSAKKIIEELKEKAQSVQWNNDNRKEHYAVFAKTFKEKQEDALLFDLDDTAHLL